jgi:hypothetical protein
MKLMLRVGIVAVCVAVCASAVGAQFSMAGPSIRGVWSPAVGSGAVYRIETKRDTPMEMEVAIVGTETIAGKTGYWLETSMMQQGEGLTVMKMFMVQEAKEVNSLRFIVQPPNEEPMEMELSMMGMMGGAKPKPEKADVREGAVRVGMETITTPAGTFNCEHWRTSDQKTDIWISEKVTPYGLVKMTSPDSSFTLVRLVTNARTKIRGTPRKFNPMQMMQRP